MLLRLNHRIDELEIKTEQQKLLTGKLFATLNHSRVQEIIENIHQSEFQVFSQWGDDGIIQFLINYLEINSKTFIEFGVENYRESITRFLLMNNNWSGLVMDGTKKNIDYICKDAIYWRHDLKAKHAFITKENINTLISEEGIHGEIGLLHIDIDGNDYWIWKELHGISPVIIIVEYNSMFGSDNARTIPYHPDFYRTNHHYSNLYWGASLLSLCDLAEEKGYHFVGCNSNGVNAYFVRKDKMKSLKSYTASDGYVLSKYRESRDKKGKLTFLSGEKRLAEITGMQVINTRTGLMEKI